MAAAQQKSFMPSSSLDQIEFSLGSSSVIALRKFGDDALVIKPRLPFSSEVFKRDPRPPYPPKPATSSTPTSGPTPGPSQPPSAKSSDLANKLGSDGKLTLMERARRIKENLCLCCGKAGHKAEECRKANSSASKARAAKLGAPDAPAPGK